MTMNDKKKSVGVYGGEPIYLDGYVPSSWDSRHSSLLCGAAWIGMGLILSSMVGFGAAIWGFATYGYGGGLQTQENGNIFGLIGLIIGVVMLFSGFTSIHIGRARYREYKEATGRVH